MGNYALAVVEADEISPGCAVFARRDNDGIITIIDIEESAMIKGGK